MTELEVAPGNTDQAAAWDGGGGEFWAAHADEFDAAVREYQPLLLAAADPGPDDRVLDVGCGAGRTTLDLAGAAARVVGVDLSGPLLEVARRRAAQVGADNVELLHADAQVHPFSGFDLVVSRTGTMFFGDPPAAFANLASGLRPGGRLVMLVWQGPDRNEWIREIIGALAAGRDLPLPPPGAPGPFALSEPDHVRTLLASAGFAAPTLEPVERPVYLGPDAARAHEFQAAANAWLLADVDEATRTRALDRLAQCMREHETADGVLFGSAMWLVTATRP